jgi:lysophospholipase L1-like esterase
MHRHFVLYRAAVIGALAIMSVLTHRPARAQTFGPILAAAPAVPAQRPPECVVADDQNRLDFPLLHTARRLASGRPIKIVALGSSSTYGAGASTFAAAYPSRLAAELAKHFPGHEFTVLNRGVNGEEVTDMLARLETAVIAERPDLVLWQVGTNSVLRDVAFASRNCMKAWCALRQPAPMSCSSIRNTRRRSSPSPLATASCR